MPFRHWLCVVGEILGVCEAAIPMSAIPGYSLRGSMTDQWDYSDYRAVNGVKMPFEIKHTNWAVVDTFKVADIKANPSIDDARFAKPKG